MNLLVFKNSNLCFLLGINRLAVSTNWLPPLTNRLDLYTNRLDSNSNEILLKFIKLFVKIFPILQNNIENTFWSKPSNRLDLHPIACLQSIGSCEQLIGLLLIQRPTDLFQQSRRLYRHCSVIAVFETD